MQRILSVEEMRQADENTINNLGIPSEILVERAGVAVSEEILSRFKGGRILIVCGKGNNGSDAKIVAREILGNHGFSVRIMETNQNELFKLDRPYDIIVDGIFGTGLNREIIGLNKEIIEKINAKKAYKISIDIPSGINGDTGKVMGVAVRSDLTIAVQEFKLGHFLNYGLDYSKKTITKDIGISIWGENYPYLVDEKDVVNSFPPRVRNTNKGSYGKSSIIGGRKDYFGAPLLSYNGLAALKMGEGYSNLTVPNSLYQDYVGKALECTMSTFSDKNGFITFDETALKKQLNYSAIAVGMGLGESEETYKTVEYLLGNYTGKLLIDADGLNSLSKFGVEILKNKKCEVVLTPHIKEFSRLSKYSVEEITDNSVTLAQEFAEKFGVTLMLKSATTVITNGAETALNITGNSGMAKGGSGDVLSGLTLGIMARGIDTFSAAKSAAYIFGKAGDIASKKYNEYTLIATEIIAEIPTVINAL